MKIDINSIGYRWKGIYSQYLTYIDGDVVFQNGNVLVYRGGTFQNFALGQQDALLAGQLLNGGVSVGGSWGQVLHSNASAGVEFRFQSERNGTIATALMDSYNGGGCYANNGWMLALMNEGMVRGWGRNYDGCMGIGAIGDTGWSLPTRVAFPSNAPRVVSMHCSWCASFFIMNDGSLWVTGTASDYQNGLGTGTAQQTPVRLSGTGDLGSTTKVASVFSAYDYYGSAMVGCIDTNGYVYMWGQNNYGACGWGNTTVSQVPKIVPWTVANPCKAVYPSGGTYSATMFITLDGRGYTAGQSSSTGQGGGDEYIPERFNPGKSELPIKKYASNESLGHWAPGSYYRDWGVLYENGDLYLWGDDSGQVGGGWGDGTSGDNYPTSVGFPKLCLTNVQDFFTKGGGYHTSVALMKDGTIKATGSSGANLNGFTTDTTTWATIGGSYLTGVTKMRGLGGLYQGCIMALRSDGKCVGWGQNDNGFTGTGTTTFPTNDAGGFDFVKLNKTIVDFQLIGQCYGGIPYQTVIYLCSDGTVWSTGYGAYGIGGSPQNDNRYTPNQIIF